MEYMQKRPIVSVIVLSYNSSSTILDTLNSIKEQTYDNIELIIADDKSMDNSVEVCKNWLVDNKGRFTYCEVVVPPENTGTSANCNRGIVASHGDWIRIIAGDDLMPEDSISMQINYLKNHPDIKILNGYSINFNVINGVQHLLATRGMDKRRLKFYLNDAKYQYNFILHHHNFGLTFGTIIHRTVFEKVTMFNEKYTLIEDLPFVLNVTKAGIKYYFLCKPTLKYRIHNSVSKAKEDQIANKHFMDIKRKIVIDMIKPNIQWYELATIKNFWIENLMYWLVFSVFKNKKSFLSRASLYFLYRLDTSL